jgi:hypothetical protein
MFSGPRTQSRLANVWPILSRTPGISRIPPELPAREPASRDTCVTLLTGGLLVRIQPEEPLPRSRSVVTPRRLQAIARLSPRLGTNPA